MVAQAFKSLFGLGKERRSRADAIPPRLPAGTRVYAVGDVHGRADLLGRICNAIRRDLDGNPQADSQVVFLGDYVDRGPQSRSVVDELYQQPLPVPTTFLRGNHEEMLLDFLVRPETGELWRKFGGIETLHSYGIDIADFRAGRGLDEASEGLRAALPADHRTFLNTLPVFHTVGGFFFCHAGVRPGVPLEQQRDHDLLWIRDEFVDAENDFGRVIVHGHTPTEQPVVRSNRIGIDTGAYITGRLTCVVLDSLGLRFLST